MGKGKDCDSLNGGKMKLKRSLFRLFIATLACAFLFAPLSLRAKASETLYLGGFATGLAIKTEGATVVGLTDVVTEDGIFSPAKNADIRVGDVILSLNGSKISDSRSIADALNQCGENPVEIVVERNGERSTKYILPQKDVKGNMRLGFFLRDDLNGIGTITYFKENGEFASLGHAISDDDGRVVKLSGGKAYLCSIIGAVKGERGKAGELKGVFVEDTLIGKLVKNERTGVYGKADKSFDYKKLPQTSSGEATMGKAVVATCVDGIKTKEYQISIVKIDKNNKENKNFVIKILDKSLLSATNGILQGMSGSPILQNGKIVGAVTHVFINDPTRGFGISIDKMLEKGI